RGVRALLLLRGRGEHAHEPRSRSVRQDSRIQVLRSPSDERRADACTNELRRRYAPERDRLVTVARRLPQCASLRDLREELRRGQNGEFGTGGSVFLGFVARYVERLEKSGAS